MTIDTPQLQYFWHLLTRLGESQILLPAALLAMLALARHADSRPLARCWLGALALATLLTTASKVAFIGWGIGSAALDFTGISGHAMFAAAVYPLLLGTLAAPLPQQGQKIAVTAGFALAFMVGLSRLEVGVHSISEVVAGLLLGSAASVWAIASTRLPRVLLGSTLSFLVALWILLTPLHIPPLHTHSLVTRLALALSGHVAPHTRHGMLSGLHGN